MMRNKNVLVLAAVGLVLLVLAFVLSRTSAEVAVADAGPGRVAKKPHERQAVVYPRDQKRAVPEVPKPEDQPRLDAMQRALLGPDSKGVVFVEANAIRNSPLMEKILRCREKESADGISRMKQELGIDPLQDVDRVGFDGDVFVASGFFDKLKIPPEVGEGDKYGDGGRIWRTKDDQGQPVVFGKVGDGMMLTGVDEAHVKAAMDRAEGRGASAASGMPAGFGEGEVYGTVGAAFLQSVLGQSDDPVAENIVKLVKSSNVCMNVDEDAQLSLDLQAVDESSAKDLSAAVGGAFAGLRAQASQDGDEELAWLLEQARVQTQGDGRFTVDAAVPGELLLKGMGCDKDGNSTAPPAVSRRSPSPASPR